MNMMACGCGQYGIFKQGKSCMRNTGVATGWLLTLLAVFEAPIQAFIFSARQLYFEGTTDADGIAVFDL